MNEIDPKQKYSYNEYNARALLRKTEIQTLSGKLPGYMNWVLLPHCDGQ